MHSSAHAGSGRSVLPPEAVSARPCVRITQESLPWSVNPDLLSSQGFGDANPVAPSDTREGRAKNRRVDTTLTGDGT